MTNSLEHTLLESPAVLIDLDLLDRHLRAAAERAKAHGIRLRPHTKTHKSVWIAGEQLRYGAGGITVAKLGEAEVMAAAGISDILIAFPLYGTAKMKRLGKLLETCQITVSVDHLKIAEGISELGVSLGRRIPLYVDVDTGLGRCGLAPGEPTAELAAQISLLPGVEIVGLMTHSGHAYSCETEADLRQAARHEAESLLYSQTLLREKGIEVPELSVGSTPTSFFPEEQQGVTEMRPGAYVFGDRSQFILGLIDRKEVAMTVKATVISMPRPGVAIIDAGSKTFSSDLNRKLPGYGEWVENPEVYVERLSEEHGNLHVPEGVQLEIGQELSFIPNHCCTVTNLQDQLFGVRKGRLERMINVDARGKIR
ncbi:alanine racemase [Paenibacillus senegalensis]|uniref:alanine racemase n=1 Tax=Paenibacillus senegalensis TaxID=1465766 RepID=UPI000287F6C1|nr:alanine racemase [Paenibacillus senegalensis]